MRRITTKGTVPYVAEAYFAILSKIALKYKDNNK